jgi:hypothetical protein
MHLHKKSPPSPRTFHLLVKWGANMGVKEISSYIALNFISLHEDPDSASNNYR